MSKTGKLIPKRRFGGFINDNEWKKNFLHEISEVYDGTHQTPNYTKAGIMFLSVENIKTLHSEKFISKEAYEKDFKIKPERNDILMTRIGDIGTANIIKYDIPIAYYVSLALIKAKLNAYFLKANITSPYIQAELWKRTLHIAFPKKINKSEIENVLVKYPDKKEQIQIGEFFKKLDILIQTQQKKLEKTKILKSAYLAEMFPADGESKPKIRFKDFINYWDSISLNKIGSTYAGLSGKSKDDFGHGNAEYITYVNIFNNPITDLDGTETIEIDDKQNQVKYGDVLFTISSETPHEVGLSSVWLGDRENVYLNSFCFGFRPYLNVDNYYFAFMLRSPVIRKKFKILAQGISRYNVSKNRVMKLVVPITHINEQTKIGNFFKLLDKKVALEQRKLEKLNNIKQAYLNEMFV